MRETSSHLTGVSLLMVMSDSSPKYCSFADAFTGPPADERSSDWPMTAAGTNATYGPRRLLRGRAGEVRVPAIRALTLLRSWLFPPGGQSRHDLAEDQGWW